MSQYAKSHSDHSFECCHCLIMYIKQVAAPKITHFFKAKLGRKKYNRIGITIN